MIYSWSLSETYAAHGAGHQPDLDANDAFRVLRSLLGLMRLTYGSHTLPQEFIELFSFSVILGRITIHRHQWWELQTIYHRVRIWLETADYGSPYFKIFLLLQAHLSRLALSPELAEDLTVVLERIFSVFSVCAHHTYSDYEQYFIWRWRIFPLMHMCVHGMREHDPELKQIPHFADDVSQYMSRQDLGLSSPYFRLSSVSTPSSPCVTSRT
jgi:hypothetical protein